MRLPLFPLNTVVFPGVVTPLHVFEDRYRMLVRDVLREEAAERVFGIVAIREGYEVGDHGMQSAHRVGVLAQITSYDALDDGRYDLEVTGRQRILLEAVHTEGDYLQADVELLDDLDEPGAAAQAAHTLHTFERYRSALSEMRGGPVLAGDLPHDPAYLSWTLAATCLLPLSTRQQLLEADGAAERLAMIDDELRGEMRAMTALPSLPATEIARTRWSAN